MIVRYSRRKLTTLLIVTSLCTLGGVWALYQMLALGDYVEPNGGRLVEAGKLIARLTGREWSFAAILFAGAVAILSLVTGFFVWLYAKRPIILRIDPEKIEVTHGWRKQSILVSSIHSAKVVDKKSQQYLEIQVADEKPVSIHLGLADNDPPSILEAIHTHLA